MIVACNCRRSAVKKDCCCRLPRLTSNGVAACAQRPGVSDGMAAEQGLQRTGSAKRRVHNWGVALVVGALSISMSQLLNTFLRDCKRLSNSGRVSARHVRGSVWSRFLAVKRLSESHLRTGAFEFGVH